MLPQMRSVLLIGIVAKSKLSFMRGRGAQAKETRTCPGPGVSSQHVQLPCSTWCTPLVAVQAVLAECVEATEHCSHRYVMCAPYVCMQVRM